jgi:hypothetical protein
VIAESVAFRVDVEQRIFVEVTSLSDGHVAELDVQRVCFS